MNSSKPTRSLAARRFNRIWILIGLGLTLSAARAQFATDDSLPPGTLAHHLATNAAGRAQGRTGGYSDKVELVAPDSTRLTRYVDAEWSRTFWLHAVCGLGATPIGFSNVMNGQGLPTMVSPRHYLGATHMHPEGYLIAFLDTNNVVHWRKTLLRLDVGNDTSVGFLDKDLPPSVGFLPVIPANYTNYLPTTPTNYVQGIGMNQDMYLFGQPLNFGNGEYVLWDPNRAIPLGLNTNWNVFIRAGDSSIPEMLLIANQLVLVTHHFTARSGPNYATQIPAINRVMHQLSTNFQAGSDYQLTEFSLTNWPAIH